MNIYLYQNWNRSYNEIQSEEDTLWYYANQYKSKYDTNFGDIETQKKANKFLKTCTNSEEWAKFAYENELEFYACKMDGTHVEAYLHQDLRKDIVIGFLDDDDDLFMYYVFRLQENGKYFLIGMKFWEWTENKKTDEDYTKSWLYVFEPNGKVEVIETEKDAKEECVWTSKRPLNVESNWEERPKFDNWEGFFKLKRWADGELDEAFKGQGAALAYTKVNYPYKALTENQQEKFTNVISKSELTHKQSDKEKTIIKLEDAFNDLPKPRENYKEASALLLKIIDFHLDYKNFSEAIRVVEKLEKYLNLDNEFMLPLYKAKVYHFANQKEKAKTLFEDFITKNGLDNLMKNQPEYYKLYKRNA